MARRPRIQFNGAIYHVLNRGNYRMAIFRERGSAAAFEKTLFETCERCGWLLHGYVVMRNHYHLALQTPKGNLVEGMQWLQSTFGNRFNRKRKEHGHVFQGRYKALLVEPGNALLRVVNYIHLNPLRAKLCDLKTLQQYSFSSFTKFPMKRNRLKFLICKEWLAEAGGLKDTPVGWEKYRQYLAFVLSEEIEQKDKRYQEMTRGWVIGTQSYHRTMLDEFKKMERARDWGGEELRQINELEWEEKLQRCLRVLDKDLQDVAKDLKSAQWKIIIASYLKKSTSASNPWLGKQLNMGAPAAVSRNVHNFLSHQPEKIPAFKNLISKSKG